MSATFDGDLIVDVTMIFDGVSIHVEDAIEDMEPQIKFRSIGPITEQGEEREG